MEAHFACRHISGRPVTGDSPYSCRLLTDIQRERATSATALRITDQQFLIASLWLRRKPQLCTVVITTFNQPANPSGMRHISNRSTRLLAGAPVHTACGAHPASCSMDSSEFFPGDKADEAWSSQLSPIQCPTLSADTRLLPHKPSALATAQSVQQLATGLRSGDRSSVEARLSAPVQFGPEAHPASCTMGTGSFQG